MLVLALNKGQEMPTAQVDGSPRLTAQQVAELLGVNYYTILKWVRMGYLPAVRWRGPRGKYRFRLSDIEEWERKQSVGKL